jgi:hypothetical protein
MTFEQVFNFVGGPVLGILTAIVAVQFWAIKMAKKEGAKEERDSKNKESLDAAHSKIRGEIMPRIEELEKSHSQTAVRLENFEASQSEMKEGIKQILETSQVTQNMVSAMRGEMKGRSEAQRVGI